MPPPESFIFQFPRNDGGKPSLSGWLQRPKWLVLFLCSLTTLFCVSYLELDLFHGKSRASSPYVIKQVDKLPIALELLGRTDGLVDSHNDFPGKILRLRNGSVVGWDITNLPNCHTDLTRLLVGKVYTQMWSAFVPCPDDCKSAAISVRKTLDQIDIIKRFVHQFQEKFEMAYTADDVKRISKQKKIASMIGMEGGHSIDSSLSTLRQFFEMGARYMTLTHSCHNPWADSCSSPPIHNGLSKFGEKVVMEMNRLGMMVDISHVSHDTMRHVARITKAPLFFSHSSAYAIHPNPRNVPDDVLQLVKKSDGVVMINFYSEFIKGSKNASISDVINHIVHIANLIGTEHIGFGADYDGVDSLPKGLEDVSKYPNLVSKLLEYFTEYQVEGIVKNNFLRVLKRTELAAQEMKHMDPIEDVLDENSKTIC